MKSTTSDLKIGIIQNDLAEKYGTNPGDEELLDDIQGNILYPHGRDFASLLLIRFDKKKSQAIRNFIRIAAAGLRNDASVTATLLEDKPPECDIKKKDLEFLRKLEFRIGSANDQLSERKRFKEAGKKLDPEVLGKFRDDLMDAAITESGGFGILPGLGLFVNFFLSAEGYAALGIEDKRVPQDELFRAGMKSEMAARALGDTEPEKWSDKYRKDIHAMLLVAHADNAILGRTTQILADFIGKYGEVVEVESGRTLRKNGDPSDVVREHFGFRDGISQPVFLDNGEKSANWSPKASLSLVLSPAPDGAFGSYFAYRKLEQDAWFWDLMMRNLGFTMKDGEIKRLVPGLPSVPAPSKNVEARIQAAGSFIMGRRPDGTSIADIQGTLNDFTYDFSEGCPFHAHVRQANPRDRKSMIDKGQKGYDEKFFMVRRGMVYGPESRTEPGTEPESLNQGLLFLSAHADLGQFRTIQRRVNPSKAGAGNGSGGDSNPPFQTQSEALNPLSLMDAVTLKGGEFFFAPALSTLKTL